MNHHHPAGMPPYGQMPMPPPQRRHEMSYSPMPPAMRPQQSYQGYYHTHMAGAIPQYPPQYTPHWYPYQQMHHHHHQPPPPRAYPSYQQHQMQQAHAHGAVMAPSHVPHQHLPHPTHPPPSSHHRSPASSSQSQFTPQTNPSSSTQMQSPFSPPPSRTPSTANAPPETPPSTSSAVSKAASEISSSSRTHPFFPPLPWSSVGDQPFPHKIKQRRRRIMRSQLGTPPVDYPLQEHGASVESSGSVQGTQQQPEQQFPTSEEPSVKVEEHTFTPSESVETPTSQVSQNLSESTSTDPTTASTADTPHTVKPQQPPTPQPRNIRPPISMTPVIPAVPILPLSPKSYRHAHHDSVDAGPTASPPPHNDSSIGRARRLSTTSSAIPDAPLVVAAEPSQPISPPMPPKSWADLVRSKTVLKPSNTPAHSQQPANGLGAAKNETLSEVLNTIDVTSTKTAAKIAFLKPRGLVNTGNMCYMNSVLQILVFTIPFHEFLERVGQRSSHSFKSDTPLVDAMILFMREFSVIDSAESFERLRLRLKPEELEQYGEPFAPEYAYQVIRQLPRFRDMRRGHQQDAQEFLGFLLEELHEECAHAMRNGSSVDSGTSTPTEKSSSIAESAENEGGWMEVGHKQRPAITRSSGAIATESPVTKIFGGKLRSEWKVPGNKNSVTLEPYQPLQLDIGSPQVNNIVDALKGLTRPESMQGDFNSSRGNRVTATKQVFIETLPPVLILHLKRFQYDNATKRTEKIWKKIGYPLDLEIPKEVFPPQVRNKLTMHGGLPRYQLTGVIYHHGKHAGGGHYTVDVRRQDGKEWIRLDDTLIRRVRSEEVAEGGSEEDPKVLAAALERHNQQQRSSSSAVGATTTTGQQQQPRGNMFEQIEDANQDGEADDQTWSQVNGHSRNKPSTAVAADTAVNGVSTPSTPRDRPTASKDSKVAYLLFYRRVSP